MSGIDSAIAYFQYFQVYIQPNTISISYDPGPRLLPRPRNLPSKLPWNNINDNENSINDYENNYNDNEDNLKDQESNLLDNLSPHDSASVDILIKSMPYIVGIEDWIQTILEDNNSNFSNNIFAPGISTLEIGDCQINDKDVIETFKPIIPFMHKDGKFSIHLKVKHELTQSNKDELKKSLCEYLENIKIDNSKRLTDTDFLDYFTKPKSIKTVGEKGIFNVQMPWIAKSIETMWNQENSKVLDDWSTIVNNLVNKMEKRFNIKFRKLPPANDQDWASLNLYFKHIGYTSYFSNSGNDFWRDLRDLIEHSLVKEEFNQKLIDHLPDETDEFFKHKENYLITSPEQRIKMRDDLINITESIPDKFKESGIKLKFENNFSKVDWHIIQIYHQFMFFFEELNTIDSDLAKNFKADGLKSIVINCAHGFEQEFVNEKSISREFLIDIVFKIGKSTYSYSVYKESLKNKKVEWIDFIKGAIIKEK